jgi:pimeloyl-ACP methyl ester carboxylesterase
MYRPLHVEVAGQGRPVVILHGVGFGPWSMGAVARSVAREACAFVVHRAGYGNSGTVPVARSVAEQVDDLIRTVSRLGADRVVLAGFAGGATIAVAAAISSPERFAGVVLHEPALGPRAAGVNALLGGLAVRVAALEAREALAAVAVAMLGSGPVPELPEQAQKDAHVISTEVPAFAAFAVRDDDLETLRALPIITTVGAQSPPARHEAAAVLAEASGARVVVLPGSAHLAQIDAPEAFAAEALAMAAEA